jgi:branched-chain amino acid transport system substrate-binding protein
MKKGGTAVNRRSILAMALACPIFMCGAASAQEVQPLRIGVLTDLSSVFTDLSGEGSIAAAQMAVDDFGGKIGNIPVEVISADMQNKADIGLNIAREWIDLKNVGVIGDVPNSAVALAVSDLIRERNKVFLASGNISTRFTGDACSPNTVHWTINSYAIANSTANAILDRGGDSWFFVTQDITSGHDMEKQATAFIEKRGGKVLGSVRHPLGTSDFSSYLLQAQASKAKVIALVNGGSDFLTATKQAEEFGIAAGGQSLVGMLAYDTEMRVLGPKTAEGTLLSESFYWNLNDQTRDFSKRFAAKRGGRMPTQFQAGIYSAITHYLKAASALGSVADGRAIVAKMKELPTDDPIFGKGHVREDGLKVHPIYLLQVKTPDQSKGEWDLYNIVSTVPADKAWRPISEGGCPLVAK